eukprot:scaffold203500_cov17-Tisochrysis_lutea.AAC.1
MPATCYSPGGQSRRPCGVRHQLGATQWRYSCCPAGELKGGGGASTWSPLTWMAWTPPPSS